MANKISEIIDEKAFAQLEKTIQLLKDAQTELAATVTSAATLNAELGKAKGYKELETAAQKVAESGKALEEASKKAEKASVETAKAEKNLIEISKEKLAVDDKAKAMLSELSGTVEQNIKVQVRLKKILGETKDALKANEKDFNSGAISLEEYTKNLDELSIQEAETKKAITDFNLEIRRGLKEANSAETSYDSMTATLDRLRGLYRRLTAEERENVEVGGTLLKSIDEYDKELKELDKTMGVYNRNVGNYSGAVTDAIESTGLFSREINFLKGLKEKYSAAAKVATISTSSFKAVLISTGIGAVLVLLGGLILFLTKTERGMDLVAKATAGVTTFVGVFVDALSTLGEQLFDNILPLLGSLGEILVGLATFDYNKIKSGFNGAGEALNNIKPINLIEVTKEAAKAAKAAADLEEQLDNLNDAEARFNVERKQSAARISELRELIADETVSLGERKKASDELFTIEEAQASKRQGFLNDRLRIQKEVNGLTKSTEADLQKERDIEIEIAEAQQETADRKRKFLKEQQRLVKEQEAQNKAAAEAAKQREKEEASRALKALQSQISLEETRIKIASDRNAKVVDDEKLAINDRLSNLQQFTENEARLVELSVRKQLAAADLLETDRLRITEEAEAKTAEIYEAAEAKKLEIIKSGLDAAEKLRLDAATAALDQLSTRESEQLTRLSESFNQGEIDEKEYTNKRLETVRAFMKERIELEIKGIEDLIAANKARGLSTIQAEKDLAALRLQLSEATTNKQIEDAQRLAEFEEELAEKKKELLNGVGNLALTIVAARFQRENEDLERQAELIEENKNKDIERVNESAASENEKAVKIAQIEAKALKQTEQNEAKKRALQEKQARFDKAVQIAGIIGSTALAIIKQLAATPLPLGAPLVATIAAIGAVQLGTAIATPIPKFATGTQNAPEGWAWVGEQGNELRTDPDGTRSLTPGKATLTYLEKGTKITPAPETKRQLAAEGLSSLMHYDKNGNYNFDKLAESYERGSKKIVDAVKSKRQISHNITAGGVRRIVETSTSRTEYLNRNL